MPAFKQENLCKSVRSVGKEFQSASCQVSHRLHRFPQMFSANISKSALKQENLCKSVRSVGNSYRFPP